MRHVFILPLSVVLAFLYSCSSTDELSPTTQESPTHYASDFTIGKTEAISMANVVSSHLPTRSTTCDEMEYSFILKDASTRGTDLPDTLVHIINYPDNNGFVVISGDRRTFPILAYSDTNSFDPENPAVKENFTDKLDAYLAESATDSSEGFDESDIEEFFDSCVTINPRLENSLHQREPWNKIVNKVYPGCPAGCVAIASAYIMSHCKAELTYHDLTFNMRAIVKAINKEQGLPEGNPDGGLGSTEPTYSFSTASTLMAWLIYYIGVDVNMRYTTSRSGANSEDAYNLIRSLGYPVSTEYLDYNFLDVLSYISKGHLIYLRGSGHAWIGDGADYCINPINSSITGGFIHCDWGWGGESNGFYNGNIFSSTQGDFTVANYFAVKAGWRSLSGEIIKP